MLYEPRPSRRHGSARCRARIVRCPGVKHPQMQWNVLDVKHTSRCWPGCPIRRGCTSCTPSRWRTRPTRSPPAITAVRWRRWSGHVGHPVPPREVGGQRPAHPRQLRRALRQRRNLMDLYPAIDLRDGRCVRLTQGDFERETVYGDDLVGQAGVRWTPARRGSTSSTSTQAQRRAGEPAGGGGHRRVGEHAGAGRRGRTDESEAEALLDVGVSRVVIGTAALEQPEPVHRLASRWLGRVALGSTCGVRRCPCTGGRRPGRQLLDVVRSSRTAGWPRWWSRRSRSTDRHRPDLGTYAELLVETELDVVAPGGAGSLDHLRISPSSRRPPAGRGDRRQGPLRRLVHGGRRPGRGDERVRPRTARDPVPGRRRGGS